jgi:hypothetical protein
MLAEVDMNLFVLSELHPGNHHVGWSVSYSLEEAIASTCDATFIYPLANQKVKVLKRYRHRLFKSWFEISDLPTLGSGLNILLVIGLNPHFLLSMFALEPLLKQFDLRLGYLLDGFNPEYLDRTVVEELDHLFVIGAEVAETINQRQPLNTSFLPLATNVLRASSKQLPRWIDIISYGRGNLGLHRALQSHFNHQASDRIYFHSTFSRSEVDNQKEHIALLSKMLDRSKISLCFEASNIPRFLGNSPILYRWFEAWAAGCTVVGKKPFGKGVAELMDWENSALDIPDDPSAWIPFFEALLDDDEALMLNAQRNYREALLRHDWRYRLRTLFETVDLASPIKIEQDIAQLQDRAYEIATPRKIYA